MFLLLTKAAHLKVRFPNFIDIFVFVIYCSQIVSEFPFSCGVLFI